MKLYEIPIEAQRIEEELAANYGELTPEMELRITEFLSAGKDKLESAAMVVRSLEADSEACMAEARRLAARAGHLDQAVERLKLLMLTVVDAGFQGKLKTAKFTIWTQQAADLVTLQPAPNLNLYELAVAHPYAVRVPEPELNKQILKDRIKQGQSIPCEITVEIVPGKKFLRIK